MVIFTIYVRLRDFGKASPRDFLYPLIFYEGRKTSSKQAEIQYDLESINLGSLEFHYFQLLTLFVNKKTV